MEPQPQTKVTQTQATLRQSQNFIVQVFSKIDLDVFFVFFPMLLSKIFGESILEGHTTRRPTTMITITVNNQPKQDRMTVITAIRDGRGGTVCFASSFCCTPDFFFCVFH